ncbi:MAG: 6-phospho-3-hexuloisomerase [Planctomycetota bacterium]|jgi:6-phospho-3-hexuloisomerase
MRETLKDLRRILEAVSDNKTAKFLRAIVQSPRVFVYGLGRSGLVARMFGMRLIHLGRGAEIVGDTTTPAIRADDLLVVCSRTGQSPILHHAVNLAHKQGAMAVAVVGTRGTPLAREADLVVRLPLEVTRGEKDQPMGSLFEQALLLYLDGIVLRLMEQLELTSEDMERIHSNLPLPSTGSNS